MARLALEHVSKVYRTRAGDVHALRDLTLTVEPGELVLLKGPSGSGKSTLLFIAGALLAPTSGSVLFEGRDLYALPARERAALRGKAIGFVFQSFHLVPYLTAEENVLLAAGSANGAAETRKQVQGLLERFGLSARGTHHPAQLSVGERQRVALLRALIHQPGVLLADEPTGNLDAENTSVVCQALVDHSRSGGSVLMATHSDAYDAYARRVVRIDQGRAVF